MRFNYERIFRGNKIAVMIGLGVGVAIFLLAPFYFYRFYRPFRSYPARIYSYLANPRFGCRSFGEIAFGRGFLETIFNGCFEHGPGELEKGQIGKGHIMDFTGACHRVIESAVDAVVAATGTGLAQKTWSQEMSIIPGVVVRGRFSEVRIAIGAMGRAAGAGTGAGAAGIPALVRVERQVVDAVLRSGGVIMDIRRGVLDEARAGIGFEMDIGIRGRVFAMTVPIRVMSLSVRLEGAPERPTREGAREAARLAIIIDDVGYNLGELGRLIKLGRPMSVAVLPHAPFAAESARRARVGGLEVLLHLPMEPLNGAANPGPYAIRCDMTDEEIRRLVLDNLGRVSGAVGANNHMGSRATADIRVMRDVLSVLADRRLFFIDSRTAPGSVAVEAAREVNAERAVEVMPGRSGAAPAIRLAVNDGFIDNQADPVSIEGQIRFIERLALRHGSAICIGHLRPTTIQTLREMIPELEGAGLRLVHVSELVH
ncbi:MAG: divergent polysaccharide deacetylase family protein [Firmicutes bacterium]|nr:divergent polysaccharide deacetylase family protein [Bacillota bacterium]